MGTWMRVGRHLIAPLAQRRHGERGNLISEHWLFHPSWWRRNFRANGFEITRDEPMGLFYTGNMTLNKTWSLQTRHRLAKRLGSACHIFELKVRHQNTSCAD